MSLFSDSGRNKLARWLINCIYFDLAICGIFLFYNFIGTYGFIREQTLSVAIIVVLVSLYIAFVDSIREKLLRLRDDTWRKISEILAVFYFFIHVIFYILIIGSLLSGMYSGITRIQISSDFLLTWAIILSVLILAIFYSRNRISSSSEYDNYRVRRPTDNFAEKKTGPYKIHEDQSCYICGKKEGLPFRGHDGRYYCKDHILPENREIRSENGQTIHTPSLTPDTRCRNPFCMREINHKEIIKCGPCGKSFCKYCWEGHRWSHGKAPAVGISYRDDGTFSGYDGSESLK